MKQAELIFLLIARQYRYESAMDAWLQQQVEELLMAYKASQQAARRKARLAIADMRRQSEENGNSSMTLDEINNEICQARNARRAAHRCLTCRIPQYVRKVGQQ